MVGIGEGLEGGARLPLESKIEGPPPGEKTGLLSQNDMFPSPGSIILLSLGIISSYLFKDFDISFLKKFSFRVTPHL